MIFSGFVNFGITGKRKMLWPKLLMLQLTMGMNTLVIQEGMYICTHCYVSLVYGLCVM